MISSYMIFFAFSIGSILYRLRMQPEEKTVLFTRMDSTAIRGIAALCVMLSHYALWMESYMDTKLSFMFFVPKQLGGIGVLIFFFLSGYGIYSASLNQEINLAWLLKRMGKVYFPYLFMKCILEIINYCLVGWNKFFIGDFVKEVTGIDFSDWFVWVIILQYIIFWIACKISMEKRIIGTFILSLVLMAVFMTLKLAPRWYNGLLLFWFGCVAAKNQKQILSSLKRKYYLKLCLSIIGIMLGAVFYTFLKGGICAECFKIVSGIFLAVFLMGFFIKISTQSPVLFWIGKRSLFIYIIHVNLWGIISRSVGDINITVPLSICMTFLITEVCYRGYGYFSRMYEESKR